MALTDWGKYNDMVMDGFAPSNLRDHIDGVRLASFESNDPEPYYKLLSKLFQNGQLVSTLDFAEYHSVKLEHYEGSKS